MLDETAKILGRMGDPSPRIRSGGFPGIMIAESTADPVLFAHMVRELVHEEPWSVRYIQRVIPIQKWVQTSQNEIVGMLHEMAGEIHKGERYRITVEKRDSEISSREIISRTADLVDGDVSLEHPDRILLVEILGEHTGLSVIRPCDITRVEKERRAVSE